MGRRVSIGCFPASSIAADVQFVALTLAALWVSVPLVADHRWANRLPLRADVIPWAVFRPVPRFVAPVAGVLAPTAGSSLLPIAGNRPVAPHPTSSASIPHVLLGSAGLLPLPPRRH